jgi:hypothetical protein
MIGHLPSKNYRAFDATHARWHYDSPIKPHEAQIHPAGAGASKLIAARSVPMG